MMYRRNSSGTHPAEPRKLYGCLCLRSRTCPMSHRFCPNNRRLLESYQFQEAEPSGDGSSRIMVAGPDLHESLHARFDLLLTQEIGTAFSSYQRRLDMSPARSQRNGRPAPPATSADCSFSRRQVVVLNITRRRRARFI